MAGLSFGMTLNAGLLCMLKSWTPAQRSFSTPKRSAFSRACGFHHSRLPVAALRITDGNDVDIGRRYPADAGARFASADARSWRHRVLPRRDRKLTLAGLSRPSLGRLTADLADTCSRPFANAGERQLSSCVAYRGGHELKWRPSGNNASQLRCAIKGADVVFLGNGIRSRRVRGSQ